MTPTPPPHPTSINRRSFLPPRGHCLGGAALPPPPDPKHLPRPAAPTSELGTRNSALPSTGRWNGVVNPPHFPIKAKRIIHLCMAGGPSHLETFDYKPKLKELDGQPFPDSFTKGQQLAQLQNTVL